MLKIKNILIVFLLFTLWYSLVFAANNFFKSWYNWDANVDHIFNPANDVFVLSWRLDLEDSRTTDYINNWYRWKVTWTINSDLFWTFTINNFFDLNYREDFNSSYNCWSGETPLEIYNIRGKISSNYWWDLDIVESDSYFCSNRYVYLKLNSDSLWDKEIWTIQWTLVDDFWKQEIYISGISKIKWEKDILSRGDQDINEIWVSIDKKTIAKKYINKNISTLFKTYSSYIESTYNNLNEFINNDEENYYLYDLSGAIQNINFNWVWDYINKWRILQIWNNWNWKIAVDWKHTVIVESWNVYINSNIYNTNDKKSLLVIISKKWESGKWWNIYINPEVTNIDAVLISDWSLISLYWDQIYSVSNNNHVNVLRKQLLIYWSVLSSNNVWTDKIPYWADYYENSSYPWDIMEWNIYDLWNLRTFNLNYWEFWKNCDNENKIAPINWNWDYILNAWAWRKECYNDDVWDPDLRKSEKNNPLIIKYNNNLQLLDPFILKSN